MRKTIAIDIDDVLADTLGEIRLYVNNLKKVSLLDEHYRFRTGKYWGYYETIWQMNGINHDGIIDSYHEKNKHDQSKVKVIEGAKNAVTRLSSNYRLVALSSRSSAMQLTTEKWILDNFGNVFDLILCIDSVGNPTASKGERCRYFNASYLIDDNIQHCNDAIGYGVNSILFGEYGWHFEEKDSKYEKCKDWKEVLRHLYENR